MLQTPAVDVFIWRLASHSAITDEERTALRTLPWELKAVGSRHDLFRIGEISCYCYIVGAGLIGRYTQVADGRRQIISIHLPGDMVNPHATMISEAGIGANALSGSQVFQVSTKSMKRLFLQFPALEQAFYRESAINAQILAQSLVSVGRRSARARIAHFLCEIGERFSRSQGTSTCAYRLPMSQEQIGDMLGLTSVHVNRMLSELRADNLIRTCGYEITIIDPAGLAWVGEFEPSYLRITPVAGVPASAAGSSPSGGDGEGDPLHDGNLKPDLLTGTE